MRISELAAATGIPTPTIKYYLRERLIPAGEATSTTRAEYDQRHIDALGLVRALLASGLAISDVRVLVAGITEPVADMGELVHRLHSLEQVLSRRHQQQQQPLRPETEQTIAAYGWDSSTNPAAATELQAALDAAMAAGFTVSANLQQRYAAAMTDIARAEIAQVPGMSPSQALRHSILGELLMERVLLAMRRLAEGTLAHQMLSGDSAHANDTSSE
ncbi:MAG: MerR family transcriptional regulator [Beutenbergiaceae bacterium]